MSTDESCKFDICIIAVRYGMFSCICAGAGSRSSYTAWCMGASPLRLWRRPSSCGHLLETSSYWDNVSHDVPLIVASSAGMHRSTLCLRISCQVYPTSMASSHQRGSALFGVSSSSLCNTTIQSELPIRRLQIPSCMLALHGCQITHAWLPLCAQPSPPS